MAEPLFKSSLMEMLNYRNRHTVDHIVRNNIRVDECMEIIDIDAMIDGFIAEFIDIDAPELGPRSGRSLMESDNKKIRRNGSQVTVTVDIPVGGDISILGYAPITMDEVNGSNHHKLTAAVDKNRKVIVIEVTGFLPDRKGQKVEKLIDYLERSYERKMNVLENNVRGIRNIIRNNNISEGKRIRKEILDMIERERIRRAAYDEIMDCFGVGDDRDDDDDDV